MNHHTSHKKVLLCLNKYLFLIKRNAEVVYCVVGDLSAKTTLKTTETYVTYKMYLYFVNIFLFFSHVFVL